MPSKNPGSGQPDPVAQHKLSPHGSQFLDLLGGEPLEGSGFEAEIPESDFGWRDPR